MREHGIVIDVIVRSKSQQKGEISTLIMAGFIALVAAATLITSTLNQSPKKTSTQASTPSCPYNSGQSVPSGSTESNASNTENRWPISQHRHEYDILGPGYFSLRSNTDAGILNLTKNDGGVVDSKMNSFMGSMFGYKPQLLAGAFDVAYGGSVPQGNDTPVKGDAPVLQVPTEPGAEVKVPQTGYDIGGGYEAMVVFATSDRVTIHIGRHEYFVGSGGNNCNGGKCSGGYWIYVKDICVDEQIVSAYNSVKGAQEGAGADKTPIQLPMVRPGQTLGKATGSSVVVGVRDNGPFISTFKPVYWQGVPEKSFTPGTQPTPTPGTNPPVATTTPGTAPTTTPTGPAPTATKTPTPTPTCAPGKPYRCPNTNQCVPAPAECEGIPTNTPTLTPSLTPTTPPLSTPTRTPGGVTPTTPTSPTTPPSSSTFFTCIGKPEGACYDPSTTGSGYIQCFGGAATGISATTCTIYDKPFCQREGGAGDYCDGKNIMRCRGVGDTPVVFQQCLSGSCDPNTDRCIGDVGARAFTTASEVETKGVIRTLPDGAPAIQFK